MQIGSTPLTPSKIEKGAPLSSPAPVAAPSAPSAPPSSNPAAFQPSVAPTAPPSPEQLSSDMSVLGSKAKSTGVQPQVQAMGSPFSDAPARPVSEADLAYQQKIQNAQKNLARVDILSPEEVNQKKNDQASKAMKSPAFQGVLEATRDTLDSTVSSLKRSFHNHLLGLIPGVGALNSIRRSGNHQEKAEALGSIAHNAYMQNQGIAFELAVSLQTFHSNRADALVRNAAISTIPAPSAGSDLVASAATGVGTFVAKKAFSKLLSGQSSDRWSAEAVLELAAKPPLSPEAIKAKNLSPEQEAALSEIESTRGLLREALGAKAGVDYSESPEPTSAQDYLGQLMSVIRN